MIPEELFTFAFIAFLLIGLVIGILIICLLVKHLLN